MSAVVWGWWPTDRRLRWLYGLIALIVCALLLKFASLLARLGWPEAAPVQRLDRIEHCVIQGLAAQMRRDGLAALLAAPPPAADSPCWRTVALPAQPAEAEVGRSTLNSKAGVAWYRFEHALPAGAAVDDALTVYVPRLAGRAWRLHVDGRPLADNLDRWRMTFNEPLVGRIEANALRPGQRLHFLLQVTFSDAAGHRLSAVRVGPARALEAPIAWRDLLQKTGPLACALALLAFALLFGAFWWARRRETAYALLALAALAWAIVDLQFVLPRVDDPAIEDWINAVSQVALLWFSWLVTLFALQVVGRRLAAVEWGLGLFVLAMSVAAVPAWGLMADEGWMYNGLTLAMVVLATLVVAFQARRGGLEIRLIAASMVLAVAAGASDWSMGAAAPSEGIYLIPYAGLLMYGSCLFALQRRYVDALQAHERLLESQARQLAEQARALTASHERLRELERERTLTAERRRLTQDMHDGLGSMLTSSLVAIEHGHAKAEDVAAMLHECVDELRMVIDSLDPHDQDLIAALASLRQRMDRRLALAGIALKWSVGDLPAMDWLGPAEIGHVMRIVQEMLSNAIRHAGAKRIELETDVADGNVRVTVRDDGAGFDPTATPLGRGLPSMRRRAARIGAVLTLDGGAGRGTRVTLSLPIRQAPSTSAAAG